jgi:hypothetical protein
MTKAQTPVGKAQSNLHAPGVTADGSVVVETATAYCIFGSICVHSEQFKPRTPPGIANPFLRSDQGGVAISTFGVSQPS